MLQAEFRRVAVAVALIAWAGVAGSSAAADVSTAFHGKLTAGAGFDYSSNGQRDAGRLPEEDVFFVPFGFDYLFDHFALTPTPNDQIQLRLSMSYLRIEAADGWTADGIGDVVLRGAYYYYPSTLQYAPAIEAKLSVKLPTASESQGLGTGAADVTLEIGLFQTHGPITPFASLGYRFVGSSKTYPNLEDTLRASVGASWRVSRGVSLGVSYDWRQSSTPHRADNHELSPYASFKINDRVKVMPYAVAGLSSNSLDFGAGVQLRWVIPVP